MRLSHRTAICLAALVLAAGCRRTTWTTSAPVAGPRVTDGEIVAIVLAACNTDVSYARMVPSRSRSAEVREFAQRMTADHLSLGARASDIAQRNGIVPADNEISVELRDLSTQRRDVLRGLRGATFDSTYAANEVQHHTRLLSALDAVLGPQVRQGELRDFVMALRPAVTAHLAHAEQMQANLTRRK